MGCEAGVWGSTRAAGLGGHGLLPRLRARILGVVLLATPAALLSCGEESPDTSVDAAAGQGDGVAPSSDVEPATDLTPIGPSDDTLPPKDVPTPGDADVGAPSCEDSPGAFGCPCESGGNCDSGYCIDGPEGPVCTETCVTDCVAPWRCVAFPSTCPDCVALCVLEVNRACAPCADDFDCQAGRCLELHDGKACGDPCGAEGECAEGYTCDVALDVCRPDGNTCTCDATNAGETRACTQQNAHGVCGGVEACEPGAGWTGCTARLPTAESCNGVDDDCNGPADDALEGLNAPCVRSNVHGDCPGLTVCAPALSGLSETGLTCAGPDAAEETCNGKDDDCDGVTDMAICDAGCTIDSVCPDTVCTSGVCVGGECGSVPLNCDDGLSCTVDSCGEEGCDHAAAPDTCFIEGACYAADAIAPESPCLRCAPSAPGAWSPAANGLACDDNEPCTPVDQCQAGACTGAGAPSCDDQNPCTDDACVAGSGCENQPNTAPCEDGAFCTTADACVASSCKGTPKSCEGATCLVGSCDEATDACTLAPVPDNTTCDDGVACTGSDVCAGGVCGGAPLVGCCSSDAECEDGNPCTSNGCDGASTCTSTPKDVGECDDGQYCTVADACHQGLCAGAPRDCSALTAGCTAGVCDEAQDSCVGVAVATGSPCADDGDDCTSDVCAGTACDHPPTGAPCDDGDACSVADQCVVGGCQGTSYSCDDGLACTDDACSGDGACTSVIAAGVCAIDGGCFADGATGPVPCTVCAPELSNDRWSVAVSGTPCDDGEACTTGDVCVDGSCIGGTLGCDDGLDCTVDACEAGACKTTVVEGFCVIAGACVAAGTPGEPCLVCAPLVSTAAWTPATDGAPCDDNALCTETDACLAGVCVGTGAKDTDDDGFIDVACGGDDCGDGDASQKPGALDAIDGILLAPELVDPGGIPGHYLTAAAGSSGEVVATWYNSQTLDLELGTNRWGRWTTATLDAAGDVGAWPALAVHAGKVHVLYRDATSKRLRYSTNSSGSFLNETVSSDTANDQGTHNAIAAADGVIHSLTYDQSNTALVYRARTGTGWSAAEVVDGLTTSAGQWPSVVAGPDRLHAAWHDATTLDLRYGERVGGVWSAVTLDGDGVDAGRFTSIGLDPAGGVVILYRSGLLGDLKVARRTGANPWTFGTAFKGTANAQVASHGWQFGFDARGGLFACGVTANSTGTAFIARRFTNHTVELGDPEDALIETLSTQATQTWCGVAAAPAGVHMLWAARAGNDVEHTVSGPPFGHEVIDGDGTVGEQVAMVRDSAGTLHAAYRDTTQKVVRYARKPAQGLWSSEIVSQGGDDGLFIALRVGADSLVHIAWFDDATDDLEYTRGTPGNFEIASLVDGTGNVGRYVSMALAPNGEPWLAYSDGTATSLKLATRGPTGVFSSVTLDNAAAVGEYTAIAIDAAGTGHVAYYDASSTALKYVRGSLGAFEPPAPIVSAGTTGRYNSMVLDDKGGVHILSTQDTQVIHVWNPSGGTAGFWQSEPVGSAVTPTAIAVGEDGTLYAAYGGSSLTLGRRSASGWELQTLQSGLKAHVALAAGGPDAWYVAHFAAAETALRLTSSTVPGWGPTTTVAWNGAIPRATAMELAADASPLLAYFDQGNSSLKLAHRADGVWHHAQIAMEGVVGDHPDLALRPDGSISVAHYSTLPADLLHTTIAGGAIHTETVVATGDVGSRSGLAIDGAGKEWLAYYDASKDDLMLASGKHGAWTTTTLESTGNSGTDVDVAVAPDGSVLVAYRFDSTADLRAIRIGAGGPGSAFSVETAGDVGHEVSLDIGSGGAAFMAHFDTTSDDLRVVHDALGVWAGTAVDATGHTGVGPSLDVFGESLLFVGYRDETLDDARLAVNLGSVWQTYTVDAAGNVGDHVAVRHGADHTVWYAYRNTTTAELRVTRITVNNTDNDCDGY